MSSVHNIKLVSNRTSALNGTIPIPGDKSISHRSLIFGSLAIGTTKVQRPAGRGRCDVN